MIDLAISKFHGENVARLEKIEARLIGIDGNGTGRKGVLQRQDETLATLADGHVEMKKSIDILVHRSGSWDKATFYRNAKWWITILLALIGSVIGYLTYRAKVGHEVSSGSAITLYQESINH